MDGLLRQIGRFYLPAASRRRALSENNLVLRPQPRLKASIHIDALGQEKG
jgi:hypothetical protein